jgi:hypothetical protein
VHGALFDALFGRGVQHDAVHVDAGQVDLVGVHGAGLHDLSTSTTQILPAMAAPG